MTMQVNFADTVIKVSVTGGLVRMVFGTLRHEGTGADATEPEALPTQELVMPVEGFVRAFGVQETVIQSLMARGIVKTRPSASALEGKIGL